MSARSICDGVSRHRGRFLFLLLALVCRAALLSGQDGPGYPIKADGVDAASREIREYLMDLEARGEGSPAPERMLSLDKTALIKIGGDFRFEYLGIQSNSIAPTVSDPFVNQRELSKSRTGDFVVDRQRLFINADIGDRWRVFVDFNLAGRSAPHEVVDWQRPPDGSPADRANNAWRTSGEANLQEAFFEFHKSGVSGFSVKAGKFDLPFGLKAKPSLLAQSYMDAPDLAGSYLMHPDAWDKSPRLPHASKFLDPTLAAMLSYEMRDIIRFDAALFQDNYGHEGRNATPYKATANYRTDDPGYRSYLVGASIEPLEGWELSFAFRNRYNRSRGVQYWTNSPYRTDFYHGGLSTGVVDPSWDAAAGQWSDAGGGPAFGSRKNEQAFTVGLALEIPNTKLSVYAEYAHGWNLGFNANIRSDGVNLGLAYRLLPRLTLHGQGEWLYVKDRSWMVGDSAGGWMRDVRGNRLYRAMVALEYELMTGLTLEGGWQYENWHFRSSYGGAGFTPSNLTLNASMFYVGTRFLF